MSNVDPQDEAGMRFPPEEELPAVRPPSTSFFVQLFLLPAIIVFGLVSVWFLFGKITDAHGTPEDFLVRMQADRGDRWKAAHDLSSLLTPNSEYVKDSQLAMKVTEAFEKGLKETASSEEHTKYLEYLAGALGRFHSSAGVPALREATRPKYPEDLRWTALLSLANLADQLETVDDPNLVLELRDLLKDKVTRMRELAAVTLGILQDPLATSSLEDALEDVEPTVRYNAARALSRFGNAEGLKTFVEMLNPDVLNEKFVAQDSFGKTYVDQVRVEVVLYEALRGIADLHTKSPDTDLQSIREPVRQLTEHSNPRIGAEAKEVLLKIGNDESSN